MNATDDPTHGQQQLSFFHGYYEEHMYHPLLAFDGESGFPLAAMLRPGKTHASHRALAVLKRLIKKLKKAYPGPLILFRADAGFAVPALYRYLERQEVSYVIGFITNNQVVSLAETLLKKAQAAYQAAGEKQRLCKAFSYQAARPGPAASSPWWSIPAWEPISVWSSPIWFAPPSSSMMTFTCCGAKWKTTSRS